ncbi:MAG: hypothetical protein C5B60_03905 [Chloroflexi bacterium]|nr:MAG: hypothetical protein C5B60_03905 [Chloroflexota bacterium]
MIQVAQSWTGGPPFLNSFMEAISQVFEVGAPLTFALATGIAEAAAAGPFIGVAQEYGHNYPIRDPNNKVIVALNTDDLVLQAPMKTTSAKTDTIVGDTYNLVKDATLGWIVDNVSQGTAGTCIITNIGPFSPLAQFQTVYFRLAASTRTPMGN